MMPEKTVWYSDNNITIYHLSEKCWTLKSVSSKDLDHKKIELSSDGTTNKATMRLCLICKQEFEKVQKSISKRSIYDKYFNKDTYLRRLKRN